MARTKKKRKVRLVDVKGPTSINIEAELLDDGNVLVTGFDTGQAPREVFGTNTHEYWVAVSAEHKDALLLALIDARFRDDQMTVSAFKELCTKHDIQFDSWSQGPADDDD